MKSFFSAIKFLTMLPVPLTWTGHETHLGRSLWYFPLVGTLIGGMLAAMLYGAEPLLPNLVLSVLSVTFLFLISRGLHTDGFADTADAFMSSAKRDRMLEIMHDSRSGPMAIASVCLLFGLKTAAIFAFINSRTPLYLVMLIPMAGRCAMPIHMSLLPYARNNGLATAFKKAATPVCASWAGLCLLGACALLGSWGGIACAVTVIIFLFAFSLYCKSMIGGYTGDTTGASCEIAETTMALALLVAIKFDVLQCILLACLR